MIGTLVLLLVFLLFWFVVVLLFEVGLDDGLVDTTCDEVDEDEVEDDFIIRIIRMVGWLVSEYSVEESFTRYLLVMIENY